MVQLFGRSWTRNELARYAGNLNQIGGVRLGELADGPGRGIRTAELDTGGGLSFTVLLDRGMDIGACKYKGASLAWESTTGPAHPAFFRSSLLVRLPVRISAKLTPLWNKPVPIPVARIIGPSR